MENWTVLDEVRISIIEGLEDGRGTEEKRELLIVSEMIVDQLITSKEKAAEEINKANNEQSKNTQFKFEEINNV
ncbi:hypothetical protein [Metabacillus endolithicus]|uniref:Phage protein n=1 Tax=Metabacillus endolithicus TaxID=1535204 RepID=A0ABW5C0P1_9BACI|nr:hypothetical protein [Metabacillus endolithicus]UPG62670.1 hypothetical protein MVE64_19730 [Metabacillus endolithicus]